MIIPDIVLSEVLGKTVCGYKDTPTRDNIIRVHFDVNKNSFKYCYINIYEFMNKCKQWISIKGCTYIEDTRGFSKVKLRDGYKFWEDKEYTPERVFDAVLAIIKETTDEN